MTIKYYLANNPISRAVKNFIARVVPNAVYGLDDLIVLMLKRGTSATEADIRHILHLFFDVFSDELKNGNFVNTPIVNGRPSLPGVFDSINALFDPSKHGKRATLSQGTLVASKMLEADIERVTQATVLPSVLEFVDAKTKTSNNLISIGSIGTILGDELKFNESNAPEGVFFIDNLGNATKAEVYSDIHEGELKFVIPNLAVGSYNLEVRRAYTKDNTIRKGVLQDNLTVA
jgi:hypothetical protein